MSTAGFISQYMHETKRIAIALNDIVLDYRLCLDEGMDRTFGKSDFISQQVQQYFLFSKTFSRWISDRG